METFVIYIAKASAVMALFFLAYYFLLRKETFFRSNRLFLLAGLATSVILPLVVYTKTIWVNPAPQVAIEAIDLNQLLQMQQFAAVQAQAEADTITINWYDVIGGMYIAGVLFFLARFIVDLRAIRKVLKGNAIIKDGRFKLIDTNKIESPFSFFNYIVYNSDVLEPEELSSIISHEKVHSAQKHSLDMISAQLFCVAFWFSPFAWFYKKSVSQNLEFIADAEAIKVLEDKKAYQKTLLKITVQPECIAITNHFYQSLIKKRIVMLNKQQSKRQNSWKYATILPILAAFMFLFQVKVVAQEKAPVAAEMVQESTKIVLEITKDTKDSELESETKVFKEKFDTDVIISNVTRNSASEITGIKVVVKDKAQSKVYEVTGNEPISPFVIEVQRDSGSNKNTIAFGLPSKFSPAAQGFVYTYAAGDNDTLAYNKIKADTLFIKRAQELYTQAYGGGHGAAMAPPAPQGAARIVLGNDDQLVVINGIKQGKGEKVTLPPGEVIGSVRVLEGKEAKKKYGREAKKGAVEITTHRGPGGHVMINGPLSYTPPGAVYGQGYAYAMPNSDVYEFHIPDIDFEIPEFDGDVMAFAYPDVKVFTEMDGDMIRAYAGSQLSKEEMETIRKQMDEARIQMEKMTPQMQIELREKLDGPEFKKAMEEMKKELDEARKEMEQARKELEESRKELKKKRSE